MNKEPLASLSQKEIEARVRGLQFQVKRSEEEDSRLAGRTRRLILELTSRGIDVRKRSLEVKEPTNVSVN